jgi:hypothetical protein
MEVEGPNWSDVSRPPLICYRWPQSSSASRFTAGAFGFLIFTQCGDASSFSITKSRAAHSAALVWKENTAGDDDAVIVKTINRMVSVTDVKCFFAKSSRAR